MAGANNIFDDLVGKIGDFLDSRVGGVVEGIGTLTGNIVDTVTGGIFHREDKAEYAADGGRSEQATTIAPPKREVVDTTRPLDALGEQAKLEIQAVKPLTTVVMDTKSPEFKDKGTAFYAVKDGYNIQQGGPATTSVVKDRGAVTV